MALSNIGCVLVTQILQSYEEGKKTETNWKLTHRPSKDMKKKKTLNIDLKALFLALERTSKNNCVHLQKLGKKKRSIFLKKLENITGQFS